MKEVAIAIDLGGTNIKGALVDRTGKMMSVKQAPTGSDLSPSAVIDRLVEITESLRSEALAGDMKPVGAGFGCPGGVYRNRAVISQSPNFPGWKDVNLRGPLEEKLNLRVALENDANVAALGEFWLGIGREVDSMVLLTLGTGIGGGIIIDGRIWQGEWGMAGEIGHITVDPDGPVCGCGNHGCLEVFASGPALVKRARQEIEHGRAQKLMKLVDSDMDKVTPEKIYEAAKAGCDSSMLIFSEAAKYIGIVIADVLNLLNVPLFVIGGGISAALDVMGPYIRQEVDQRAYRVPAANVRIERAALGNRAGVLGAGYLVFQEFGQADTE